MEWIIRALAMLREIRDWADDRSMPQSSRDALQTAADWMETAMDESKRTEGSGPDGGGSARAPIGPAHAGSNGQIVTEPVEPSASEPPRTKMEADVEEEGEDAQDFLIRRDNVFGTEIEDALRRDFTINGLFYDIGSGKIIDHVGGLEDVKTRYLRMIGDPEIRLREDPVRILRAIR